MPILDNKVHGAYIWPTWFLSVPGGPHVGPMSLAVRDVHTFHKKGHWLEIGMEFHG